MVRGVSQRRACVLVAANRATVQYQARPRPDDGLSERLAILAQRHPRYGYRRIWALLQREGWHVNRKRVHRLWRTAQLQVPKRRRSRPGGRLTLGSTSPLHTLLDGR